MFSTTNSNDIIYKNFKNGLFSEHLHENKTKSWKLSKHGINIAYVTKTFMLRLKHASQLTFKFNFCTLSWQAKSFHLHIPRTTGHLPTTKVYLKKRSKHIYFSKLALKVLLNMFSFRMVIDTLCSLAWIIYIHQCGKFCFAARIALYNKFDVVSCLSVLLRNLFVAFVFTGHDFSFCFSIKPNWVFMTLDMIFLHRTKLQCSKSGEHSRYNTAQPFATHLHDVSLS